MNDDSGDDRSRVPVYLNNDDRNEAKHHYYERFKKELKWQSFIEQDLFLPWLAKAREGNVEGATAPQDPPAVELARRVWTQASPAERKALEVVLRGFLALHGLPE